MTQLNKSQVNSILKNAPEGVDQNDVLIELINNGYELEGVDTAQAKEWIAKNSQPTVEKVKPTLGQNIKTALGERKQNVEDIKALREEGKTALGEVASMVGEKVAPILPGVGKAISSVGEKVDKFAAEKPGIANLLRTVPTGGIDVPVLGQAAGAVQDVIGETLSAIIPEKWAEWGTEKAKQVAETALAQAGIKTIEEYNAWAEKYPLAAKNIEGVANIGLTAGDIVGAGEVVSAGTQSLKSGAKAVAKGAQEAGEQIGKISSSAGKIASDIIPTKSEFMSGQISKALDLTQGDLSNIKLSTGNDVGKFIADNNIIGATKKETLDAVKSLTDTQYKEVRNEISKVSKIYQPNDIPKVKQSLDILKKQVKDVPGLENTYKEVISLLKKKSVKLNDVQKVKELLDDQFNLFKATGDVKEGTIKKGLANVRKDLKQFIEKEVKDTTGADIGKLNNDVATGKSILQLANKRATREFTRANVSLSDLGAFGSGSLVGSPLLGAAAVAVKRIVETPTVRLQVAKLINSLPKATQKTIQKELLNGKVPKVIKDVIKTNS